MVPSREAVAEAGKERKRLKEIVTQFPVTYLKLPYSEGSTRMGKSERVREQARADRYL